MRDSDDTLSLLMLAELRGVGEQGAASLIDLARTSHRSLTAILSLPPALLARDTKLNAVAIAQLTSGRAAYATRCRDLLDRIDAANVTLSSIDSTAYPARWRMHAKPPPPVAYSYGNRTVLHAPTVAVLNSRTITAPTISATIRLVHRLSAEQCTLVTGGMKSTYRIAAVAARAAGIRRVLVLDRGLFAAFPHGLNHDPSGFGPNHSLLDPERTLVMSSFRMMDHAAPHNGRRRDQLIAAMADVVIAVNARPGGEIERACLRALDAGQCVLSWLGENSGLMEAGARLLDETELAGGLRRFLDPASAGR